LSGPVSRGVTVKAWIRQQLAARGERAEAEATNVRPFAAIAELSGEDGWK
jgi:hypothetical protein